MSSRDTTLEAWAQVCTHCDGTALVGILGEIYRRGGLRKLPRSSRELAADAALRPGHAALACKLLRHLGWVRSDPEGDPDAGLVETEAGLAITPMLPLYGQAPVVLNAALALMQGSSAPLPQICTFHGLVRAHLQGPMVAAAATVLGDRPCAPQEACQHVAAELLSEIGWITRHGASWQPTDLGRITLPMTRQYGYVISYLASFAGVRALFDGQIPPAAAQAEETHVDRARDVAFSGEVFARSCATPFLELLRPIFDRDDAAQLPRAIVDTGCGDGTVLAACHAFITGGTRCPNPPLLVGIEVSETARRIADARLAALGTPYLTFLGDIADPSAIAERLAEHNLDPLDVLHVSKSVLHNRSFETPRMRSACPPTEAVFVAPGGDLLDRDAVFSNLVEVLARWRRWTTRHGMVIIEAHTVSPALTPPRLGLSPVIPLDAAHGLSGQLLVEAALHRAAIEAAGFRRLDSRETGEGWAGTPLMTIERILPLSRPHVPAPCLG